MSANPIYRHASQPVNVLQIDGTSDNYLGWTGPDYGMPFVAEAPGAVKTVQNWAHLTGCREPVVETTPSLDLSSAVAGIDTTVLRYTQCPPGGAIELWTVTGGTHVPTDSFKISFPFQPPSKRITPTQALEAVELSICAQQLALMFHGQRRKISVRRQVPGCAQFIEKTKKTVSKHLAGLQHDHTRLIKPGSNMADRNRHLQRRPQHTRMRHQPDKPRRHDPWQADGICSVERSFPPSPGGFVLRVGPVVSIDKEVNIRNDHELEPMRRKVSPSNSSSTWLSFPRSTPG
jgi:hypothetical protein